MDYSFHLKSLLMMQHAIYRSYPTIVTVATCIYTLIKHKEFGVAKYVLESGADEFLMSDEMICLGDLDSVVGPKTKMNFAK